jgi:hypothetical protein
MAQPTHAAQHQPSQLKLHSKEPRDFLAAASTYKLVSTLVDRSVAQQYNPVAMIAICFHRQQSWWLLTTVIEHSVQVDIIMVTVTLATQLVCCLSNHCLRN